MEKSVGVTMVRFNGKCNHGYILDYLLFSSAPTQFANHLMYPAGREYLCQILNHRTASFTWVTQNFMVLNTEVFLRYEILLINTEEIIFGLAKVGSPKQAKLC